MSKLPTPTANATSVAEEFIGVVSHLMKHNQAPMVNFVEQYDLSFTQLKLMYALSNAEQPLPIGRLAEQTGASLPAAGRAVDGLVRHDLVTRTEDPDDRRVKRIELTELGAHHMDTIAESRLTTLTELLEQFGERDLAALSHALAPLRAQIPAPLGCAEPANPNASETEVSR